MNWILNLVRRRRIDRGIAEEVQAHLDERVDDLLESGMSEADARRQANREFGNVTLIVQDSREVWRWLSVESWIRDLRYGIRQLRRTPGLAAVATVTLGLGIGANTAIFSVMNAVILRFLPVPNPHQLVFLNTTMSFGTQSGDGDTSLTEYIYEQLRDRQDAFSDLVAFAPLSNQKVSVRYGGMPEEAQANLVNGNFFFGLGVRLALGRPFTMEDETNHAPIAILSYGYWSRRFGRDPTILGQTLYIKGVPFTITGVADADFAGVENSKASDIWVPLQDRPELKPWGQSALSDLSLYGSAQHWWCLKMIGRLAPGASEKEALARLNPMFQRAAMVEQDASRTEPPQLYFTSARGIDGLRDNYKQPLTVLMVMVGVVLLIACANIAMLLIARNAARQRELSIRIALGGSHACLFRQLLAESLLLVAAGAAVGWLFALWTTSALAAWARLDLRVAPDSTVLIFTLTISLLVVLLYTSFI